MKSVLWLGLTLAIAMAAPAPALAAFELELSSTAVLQGEPVLVVVRGATSTAAVSRISFNGASLGRFVYRGTVGALLGTDLRQKPGAYIVSVALADGTTLTQTLTIAERPKAEAPLGIPEKLGGNTEQSASTLVSTLAAENASLANIKTGTKAFWSERFRWPLASITVTDPYGYARQTGSYSIAHKGTDFRAKEGTPVSSINRGVVRIAKTYRDYGKTVVVDHGLGVQSFYMHLSKISVYPGELVLPGQTLGLSGKTGYAEQPHLHLTIRINGISVDPMTFFSLFN